MNFSAAQKNIMADSLSDNVKALRFMAKSADSSSNKRDDKLGADTSEKWALTGFDPKDLVKSSDEHLRLKSISVMARRSYGGMNPYIEQHMQSMLPSKRKAAKVEE
jgi:hypothetical protein